MLPTKSERRTKALKVQAARLKRAATEARRAWVVSVWCPQCGAPEGSPCVGARGYIRLSPHAARTSAAREAE